MKPTTIIVVATVCVTAWFTVHEVVRLHADAGPCVDEVHSPDEYFHSCPDVRQKLVVPTGWTWFKCECPEAGQ